MTPEMVDQMDLQKSLAFYRERFADASGFTFVFVGSFKPEDIKPLVEQYLAGLMKEVAALAADGPTERQVNDVREAMLREYETSMRQNGYLLSQIRFRYQFGDDLETVFTLPQFYKKVMPATIHEAAKKYLDTSNVVTVTLFPEKKQEPPAVR